MILKMLEVGPLMVNCYIVGDEEAKLAAVFDPGGNVDQILKVLAEDGLTVKYIINTHTHWDHVGGNAGLAEVTSAPILTHKEEAPALEQASLHASAFGAKTENSKAGQFVAEGDTIELGSLKFQVLDVRGHSPAGLAFVTEGEIEIDGKKQAAKLCICGDALFAGSIGRTDFPGGDYDLLIKNIKDKIFTLGDETLVLSGHGPVTTVGREKQYNPFFR